METKIEILNTEREFLEDSYKFNLKSAKLISIEDYPKDDSSFALIFDKTIFHPQGGGQPSDEGEIENLEKGIKIPLITIGYDREREVVLHKVSKSLFNSNQIQINDYFDMKINEEKRKLFARIHSAGHLLDISIDRLGLNLIPGKGYHFPDGPFVEYSGNIDKNQIPSLIQNIENISNEIISDAIEEDNSITKFYDYEEGLKEFKDIPSYLPINKPFRWVKLIKNEVGCPCGGTHVKHVKEIQKIKITKITNKGKLVRISYNVI